MGRALHPYRKLLVVALLGGGCQAITPSDGVQCRTTGDCAARGGEFATSQCIDTLCVAQRDACVGRKASFVEDKNKPVLMRVRVLDERGVEPIADLEIVVCDVGDDPCPVGLGRARTDAAGYVNLMVARNFMGTLQIQRPPGDYMKTKVHFFRAIEESDEPTAERTKLDSIPLIKRGTLKFFVQAKTPMLDPQAGHIVAVATDCALVPRGGVSVKLTTGDLGNGDLGGTIPFFLTPNRLPVLPPNASETLEDGVFGFANVPQGSVALDATIVGLGKKSARALLWLNPDTVSTFLLGPTAL